MIFFMFLYFILLAFSSMLISINKCMAGNYVLMFILLDMTSMLISINMCMAGIYTFILIIFPFFTYNVHCKNETNF